MVDSHEIGPAPSFLMCCLCQGLRGRNALWEGWRRCFPGFHVLSIRCVGSPGFCVLSIICVGSPKRTVCDWFCNAVHMYCRSSYLAIWKYGALPTTRKSCSLPWEQHPFGAVLSSILKKTIKKKCLGIGAERRIRGPKNTVSWDLQGTLPFALVPHSPCTFRTLGLISEPFETVGQTCMCAYVHFSWLWLVCCCFLQLLRTPKA